MLLQQESVRHHPGDLAGNSNSINSRQGKKAPLPHEHEPHTIVGITVGAFLLIFIGTGKKKHFKYQLIIYHSSEI